MTTPNKKQDCDFDAIVKGEKWHIHTLYKDNTGKIVWYEGFTARKYHGQDVAFLGLFDPSEINII